MPKPSDDMFGVFYPIWNKKLEGDVSDPTATYSLPEEKKPQDRSVELGI